MSTLITMTFVMVCKRKFRSETLIFRLLLFARNPQTNVMSPLPRHMGIHQGAPGRRHRMNRALIIISQEHASLLAAIIPRCDGPHTELPVGSTLPHQGSGTGPEQRLDFLQGLPQMGGDFLHLSRYERPRLFLAALDTLLASTRRPSPWKIHTASRAIDCITEKRSPTRPCRPWDSDTARCVRAPSWQ